MKVELGEQFLLDPGADAVAEEGAVGDDDGGAGGDVERRSVERGAWSVVHGGACA